MARLAAANQPLPRIWEALSSHPAINRLGPVRRKWRIARADRRAGLSAGRRPGGRPVVQVLVSKHGKLAGMFASSALSDERPVGECGELRVGHPAHARNGVSSRRRRVSEAGSSEAKVTLCDTDQLI